MTVIRGGTDDDIRAQVVAAGGTERDADVVIGFTRFLRTAGPPPRPPHNATIPGEADA